MSASTFASPRMAVPDSKKDEQYHKDWLYSILNNSMAGGFFPTLYQAMDISYRYYNGTVDTGQGYEFLQGTTDGKSYPAVWLNYNNIKNKVDLLVGELSQRGFEIGCKTVNSDAQTRKMKYENMLLAERQIKKLFDRGTLMQVEEAPIGFSPEAEMDDDDLKLFLRSKYKEKYEIAMERILRYDVERLRYKNMSRKTMFMDMLIAGRCVAKEDVQGGVPLFRRIDPRYVIVDPFCNDDLFSDARYVAEYRYMGLSEAAERYGLTLKQLQEAQDQPVSSFVWYGMNWNGLDFLNPFLTENGQLRVLVVYAEWKDIKSVKYKKGVDKYGEDHWKKIKDDKDAKLSAKEKEMGYTLVSKHVECVRRATLIGGTFLKEWGEMPNQPRQVDMPEYSKFSYTVLAPNYVNYTNTSMVQTIEALQQFKDLTMYTIQQRMSVAMGKGLMYDLRYKPEGFELEDVVYYLKANGFAFYDSGREDLPVGGNPFTSIDATLSQDVNLYLMISQYIDQQMNQATGINDSRQGFTKASQLVGVTQQAMVQSSLITEPNFNSFMEFEKVMLQRHADTVKTTWKYVKDKYAAVMGDVFSNMLEEENENFYLQDYGLFIEVEPQMVQNRNMLVQMVMTAVQGGQVDLGKALILLTEPDTKVAIAKFLSILDKEQQMEAQQQMQQMKMQQDAALAKEAAIADREVGLQEVKNEGDIAKKMTEGDIRKDLQSQKLLNDNRNKEQDMAVNLFDRVVGSPKK